MDALVFSYLIPFLHLLLLLAMGLLLLLLVLLHLVVVALLYLHVCARHRHGFYFSLVIARVHTHMHRDNPHSSQPASQPASQSLLVYVTISLLLSTSHTILLLFSLALHFSRVRSPFLSFLCLSPSTLSFLFASLSSKSHTHAQATIPCIFFFLFSLVAIVHPPATSLLSRNVLSTQWDTPGPSPSAPSRHSS